MLRQKPHLGAFIVARKRIPKAIIPTSRKKRAVAAAAVSFPRKMPFLKKAPTAPIRSSTWNKRFRVLPAFHHSKPYPLLQAAVLISVDLFLLARDELPSITIALSTRLAEFYTAQNYF